MANRNEAHKLAARANEAMRDGNVKRANKAARAARKLAARSARD